MSTTSVRPPAADEADVVGRQLVRDPDTYLAVAAVVVGTLASVQLLLYPAGRSHCEYLLWGRELALGQGPTATLWSYRAPGIGLLYALFHGLGFGAMSAVRLVEFLLLLGAFPLFARLTKQLFDNERIGTVGAGLALYVHSQLEFEHTGQPELFASACFALALWKLLPRSTRPREWRGWMVAGALLGLSILFAPALGLCLLPVAIVAAWHRSLADLRRAPLFPIVVGVGGGVLMVLGLFVAWLAGKGMLRLFVSDWIVPMWRMVASTSVEQLVEWAYFCADRLVLRQSAVIPIGCLLAFAWPSLHARERSALRVLLAVVVAQVVAFTLIVETNPGRLSAALPWLSLVAAVGIYKAWRRAIELGRAGVAAFVGALLLLALLCTAVDVPPGTYFSRSRARLAALVRTVPSRAAAQIESELYDTAEMSWPSSRRVAFELAARRASCDFVVVGDEPQIPALLKCRPLGRLARPLAPEIAQVAPELDNRMSSVFEQLRPRFVVVSPSAGTNQGSLAVGHGLPPSVLPTEYETRATIDGWVILERLASP